MQIEIRVINIYKGSAKPYIGKFESMQKAEAWIAKQTRKGNWGQPARQVHEDSASEEVKRRVLTKERGEDGKWLLNVKADYDIEIWKRDDYSQNRAKEYPAWEVVMEALMENMEMRPQKLNEIKKWREHVRAKYPKDSDELLERR